jgi:DNA-binding CsgD family transcriptional regulator
MSVPSEANEYGLTARQMHVLRLIAEGYTSKQIAEALAVSAKTVEFHRREAEQRLGVKGTALLVRECIRRGLIKP